MNQYAETVVVDLAGTQSSDDLLHLLGEIFEFGGPDGNVSVTHSSMGKGWGFNWDALQDSLCYLDTGGIWGTSRKRQFPLLIHFINSSRFRTDRDGGYSMLVDILESVKAIYLPKQFDYFFE